jgi:RNA polymerase sigma-70 factor (sigma-E family)
MPDDDGVEESFTAFVRASGERHLRVAVLLTGDWHAAEDLVQASLVKLYRAWPGVDQVGGEPDAYLRRIIVNTHRSWWRARWRREAPTAQLPDTPGRGDGADQRALAASIRQALRRLSPRQRAVLVLRYYEDLPEAEIAALLRCSPGTVKTHAHRGLRALRAELGPLGELDELGALGGQWPPGDPPAGEHSAGAGFAGARSAGDLDPVFSDANGKSAGAGRDPR